MGNFTINALSSQGSQRSLDKAGRVLENSELHCSALLTSCSRLLKLTAREVKLSIAGSVYDPTDPMGKLLFNVLAMVAEFEADLIRARTREGMKVAKAKGRLRGKSPKLTPRQEAHLVQLHAADEHTVGELAELFSVGRSTVYRALQRAERGRENAFQ